MDKARKVEKEMEPPGCRHSGLGVGGSMHAGDMDVGWEKHRCQGGKKGTNFHCSKR